MNISDGTRAEFAIKLRNKTLQYLLLIIPNIKVLLSSATYLSLPYPTDA